MLTEHPGFTDESAVMICAEDGSVIGSAFLIDCKFPINGCNLKGAFISTVSIAIKARSKGMSRLLMGKAIEQAKNFGAAVAVVIASRALDGFYSRFDFWWGYTMQIAVCFASARLGLDGHWKAFPWSLQK